MQIKKKVNHGKISQSTVVLFFFFLLCFLFIILLQANRQALNEIHYMDSLNNDQNNYFPSSGTLSSPRQRSRMGNHDPGSKNIKEKTTTTYATTTATHSRTNTRPIISHNDEIDSDKLTFIIFEPMGSLKSQGFGNIVTGLLAAHLFGEEFNRIVCVSPEYTKWSFLDVFDAKHPLAVRFCPLIFQLQKQKQLEAQYRQQLRHKRQYDLNDETGTKLEELKKNTSLLLDKIQSYEREQLMQFKDIDFEKTKSSVISLINYESYKPPNECRFQEQLMSDNIPIIFFSGNTYPRWCHVPDNFFYKYYTPKQILLEMLPYDYNNSNEIPNIVVHLRMGDSAQSDRRKGLDEQSLNALGKMLPSSSSTPTMPFYENIFFSIFSSLTHSSVNSNTDNNNNNDRIMKNGGNNSSLSVPYLVTNHVEWFDEFEQKYGWRHPNWKKVKHSQYNDLHWGKRQPKDNTNIKKQKKLLTNYSYNQGSLTLQTLQLWCDWYTILNAKIVYHTHSDFSNSAIHWMGDSSSTVSFENQVQKASKILNGYDHKKRQLILIDESWIRDGLTPRLVDRIKKDNFSSKQKKRHLRDCV